MVLRTDGAVVAIGGALLLAAADPVGAFLGIAGSPGLRIAGALCVGYGGWLFWTARRYSPDRLRGLVAAIAGGNAVWVLGSILVLLTGTPALTVGGRWAVAALAVVVALFAAAQVAARRQLRQQFATLGSADVALTYVCSHLAECLIRATDGVVRGALTLVQRCFAVYGEVRGDTLASPGTPCITSS